MLGSRRFVRYSRGRRWLIWSGAVSEGRCTVCGSEADRLYGGEGQEPAQCLECWERDDADCPSCGQTIPKGVAVHLVRSYNKDEDALAAALAERDEARERALEAEDKAGGLIGRVQGLESELAERRERVRWLAEKEPNWERLRERRREAGT